MADSKEQERKKEEGRDQWKDALASKLKFII